MTTAVSEERLEQRAMALARANEVRMAHRRIRVSLSTLSPGAGAMTASQMLEQPSGYVPSMRIGYLLTSVPKLGPETVKRWMVQHHIPSMDTHVRELSAEKRQELADHLSHRVHSPRKPFVVGPSLPAKPAPKSKPKPVVKKHHQCQACGEELRRPTVEGLCGFCSEQIALYPGLQRGGGRAR